MKKILEAVIEWLKSLLAKEEKPEPVVIQRPVEEPTRVATKREKQEILCAKLYNRAAREIGVKEVAGEGNNKRVIEYHDATTLSANEDSVPWCSSFVSWVIEKEGVKSTKDAWARSYLQWGEATKEPVKGCVVVFTRGQSSGHVAFFHKREGNDIYVLGGNQGDAVNIKAYGADRLLGYRLPLV